MFRVLFTTFILFVFTSCISKQTPLETYSRDYAIMNSGDLVVTNYSGDSALLLDEDGNFKQVLYNVDNNREQVLGVNWNASTKEVVLSINGSPDRVVSISPLDGTVTETIVNGQYNGNTYGLTVDSNGDYLLIESHQIEKFTSAGARVNDGTFPTGTLFNNLTQINNTASGGFVVCGYGGDLVATYDSAANQLASKASGIASTTNGYGCDVTATGDVVASWDGTTDTVALYSSDFTTTVATYSDTTYLTAPRGVEVKADGNILIADGSFHYIVELDSSLNFVRTIGGGILNYPWQILEIPAY